MTWFNEIMARISNLGAPAPETYTNALQAMNSDSVIVSSTDQSILEMRRYACTCAITVDGEGKGTGFLVGRDLILTNYHVVVDDLGQLRDPKTIKCRFGFFATGEFNEGRHDWVTLPADPNVAFAAYSPTAPGDRNLSLNVADYRDQATNAPLFDYALLRLTQPVGDGAGKDPTGRSLEPLGWIVIDPERPLPTIGQPLLVVEFPEKIGAGSFRQDPMGIADGKLEALIAEGARGRHNASTRPGASGGPVFDSKAGLIGLHNAGLGKPDGKVDNRFIPISSLMQDIRAKQPLLYDTLVTAIPPRPAISGSSPRMNAAVQERVRAARIVVDREREHASILAALAPDAASPVQVNHVTCRYDDDGIDDFIERLRISAARVENLRVADITAEFLRGQSDRPGAFKLWQVDSITWPDPNTSSDQARLEIKNQLLARSVGPRTLLVVKTDLVDRDPAMEIEYMRLLGEAMSDYATRSGLRGPPGQILQAIVIYQIFRNDPANPASVAIDHGKFAPLWKPDAPPKHCGVSVLLRDVQRNDVEPWATLVNAAWFPSPASRDLAIAVPREVTPGIRFSMKQLMALLDPPLTRAAIALVEQKFQDLR